MSEKETNKVRCLDDEGYRQRAACICTRTTSEDEILLITSGGKSSWIIPGGGIEPNESTSEAALRELYEEAGVKGRIIRELGVFENGERKHRTSVFVVVLEEEFDDWDEKRLRGRQRRWYAIEEAWTMLHLSKPFQFSFLERFILSSPNCRRLLRRIDHS